MDNCGPLFLGASCEWIGNPEVTVENSDSGGEDCEDEIQDALDAYKRRVASAGGKARAKKVSAERRKKISTKASKAAAKVRSEKAARKVK